LGERIARGRAFEVRAGDIVEEQLVVEREELAESLNQMLLQRRLVGEQAIQRAIAAVVVDQRCGQREHIVEGGAPIPLLRDVQLARRLAQPGQHEDQGHGGPRHLFTADGQQPLQPRIQVQGPPQRPAQPDVAEEATPLQPDAIQPNRNRRRLGGNRREQIRLLAPAGDRAGQRPRLGAALGVELTELRHRLLHDLAADAHRADQAPVGVGFAVLHARRVAQVHCPAYPTRRRAKSMHLVGTTS
jgi:hypothetical protein